MRDGCGRAEDLVEQGFQCLEEHDFDEAIRIGLDLKERRHSSAFEILALAYAEKEQKSSAISILEEGVEKAPAVWILWQLLGNYYSDEGRFRDCHEAYRKALECPGVNDDSVGLNTAIALDREGRLEEALEALDMIGDDDQQVALRAKVARLGTLNKLGRCDTARRLAEDLVHSLPGDAPDDQVAAVHAEHGVAIWNDSQDAETALSCAWKAVEHRRDEATALWLVREIDGEVSRSARYLRILVEGEWAWDDDDGPLGFYTSYDVVADSVEEGLRLLKRFEPQEIRDSLRVESWEDIEARPDEPKGVYRVTGYVFFPLEGDDEDG